MFAMKAAIDFGYIIRRFSRRYAAKFRVQMAVSDPQRRNRQHDAPTGRAIQKRRFALQSLEH